MNIDEDKNFTLKWVDESVKQRPLAEEGPDEEDLVNLINPTPIMNHKQQRNFRPIVKGSRQKLMLLEKQQHLG